MPAPISLISRPSPEPTFGNDRWGCWPWASFHLKRARELWDAAPVKTSILVAVIDDGFDLAHPALRDRLWEMPGRSGMHGWDFINNDPEPWPTPEPQGSSHGTMVTGIIGGRSDLADSFSGVAPNATLMLLRWRSRCPREAHANPATMADALRFAIEHGARIVNLSAGIDTNGKSSQALVDLRSAFALAARRGVLVVVAAPNLPGNMDLAVDRLPGVFPFTNIIHVTGLCRDLRLLGAWGERSVDIAAPAEDIMGPTVGGGYAPGCATSFAAPLVTGALALVWGLLPKLRAAQVRRLVLRNAKSIEQEHPSADTLKCTKTNERASTTLGRLQPHQVWGHEPPAKAEGRLDLAFIENACERYWAGRPFPGFFGAGAHKSSIGESETIRTSPGEP